LVSKWKREEPQLLSRRRKENKRVVLNVTPATSRRARERKKAIRMRPVKRGAGSLPDREKKGPMSSVDRTGGLKGRSWVQGMDKHEKEKPIRALGKEDHLDRKTPATIVLEGKVMVTGVIPIV